MNTDTASGIPLAELARPVGVDVEQHIEAAPERSFERRHGCAVEVAVHLGPFRELVPVPHGDELGAR